MLRASRSTTPVDKPEEIKEPKNESMTQDSSTGPAENSVDRKNDEKTDSEDANKTTPSNATSGKAERDGNCYWYLFYEIKL